jgi:hypothetical protein
VDGRDVAVAATELGVELAIANKEATTDQVERVITPDSRLLTDAD